MKEYYFKYIFQKKSERRTKQKQKLNALVKETHQYWERSNSKGTLEIWRKPLPASELWLTEINIIPIWLRN